MTNIDWLHAHPIAHRGYHGPLSGEVENTLGAIRAACDRGFSVEIDVHLSADGEVFVFHDETLDRLTTQKGLTAGRTLAELQAIAFKETDDRIPSLKQVLAAVDGRQTLLVEVKSHFSPERQTALVDAVARELKGYKGHVAVMSFDDRIVEDFANRHPEITRGIVADDASDPHDYGTLNADQRYDLAMLTHLARTRPDFVAYWVKLLPNAVATRCQAFRLPLLTWTVRNPADREIATRYANQIIFEGFDPEKS